jgi:hypothetical protein
MTFSVIVNAATPANRVASYYVGWHDTIRAAEAGIRHAVGLARAAGGTAICVRFIDRDTGRCRYLARVKQEVTANG